MSSSPRLTAALFIIAMVLVSIEARAVTIVDADPAGSTRAIVQPDSAPGVSTEAL